tara:strand:+ start:3733 stop:4047 length:315 start_codon:yes stop_codon:yes gene_type:complete
MALKIEITGADDILQFMKVLFVASDVIQKQVNDKVDALGKNTKINGEFIQLEVKSISKDVLKISNTIADLQKMIAEMAVVPAQLVKKSDVYKSSSKKITTTKVK